MHQPALERAASAQKQQAGAKAEHSPDSGPTRPSSFAWNLQRVAGNRAVSTLIHLQQQAHPRLPAYTPAWSDQGQIHVLASTLLLPSSQRDEILRHERIHQFQQILAPADESADARHRAESTAAAAERSATPLTWAQAAQPVPSVLGYPPRAYAPWNRVWIGYPGLVVEVVVSGVSVRVYKDYADLGISPGAPETYECGTHDTPPMKDLAAKMRTAGQLVAKRNASLPPGATAQRVALVVVSGKASGFRTYKGQGMIAVNSEDFESSFIPTVEHEAAHSLFEFHSVAGKAGPSSTPARVPDAAALRIADIYVKLKDTTLVPVPTKLFDPHRPPALKAPSSSSPASSATDVLGIEETETQLEHAGHVMVMDTLWSGSGGHPWQGVDEFFASAYSGYLQNPGLLRASIRFYERADPKIEPLAKSLMELLGQIGSLKKAASVRPPAAPSAAEKSLEDAGGPLELTTLPEMGWIEGRLNWLLEPSEMPGPSVIRCPDKTSKTPPSSGPSLEEILESK